MLVEEDDVQQLPMARISTRSQCCWAGSIHQHSTPCEVTAGRQGEGGGRCQVKVSLCWDHTGLGSGSDL